MHKLALILSCLVVLVLGGGARSADNKTAASYTYAALNGSVYVVPPKGGGNAAPGLGEKPRLYFAARNKWPANTITVCWENPEAASSTEEGWVQEALAQTWERYSPVRFTGWGKCPAALSAIDIRIQIKDDANDGPRTLGLGTEIKHKRHGMVLDFAYLNWSTPCAAPSMKKKCDQGIAAHEFGHALGFAHEQNRPDTPGECALQAQGENGTIALTPWDLQSIMNYCNPKYMNNAQLSKSDQIGLVLAYPPVAAGPNSTATTGH